MMKYENRCFWAKDVGNLYIKYHDEEWGVPVYDDHKLFEMLLLESFQAGLSWETILKKREGFRKAFDNFDVEKIANYDETKAIELRMNPEIIRNQLKIKAAIKNAQVFMEIQREFGSFSEYIWKFSNHEIIYLKDREMTTTTPLSDEVSVDLKRRGMNFVGSVIIYSYLQAIGICNDHSKDCYLHVA